MTTDGYPQQTAANAEQIRDIEGRVQSLAEASASPTSDQDSEEKARRKALRKFVPRRSEMDVIELLTRTDGSQ